MDFSVFFGLLIGFSDHKSPSGVKGFDKPPASLYNNIRFEGKEQEHG